MFLSAESGWPFASFLQPIIIRLGHPLILFNMEYSKKKRPEISKGILCHVLGRCSDQAWMLLHENYRRDGFCLYSPLVSGMINASGTITSPESQNAAQSQ